MQIKFTLRRVAHVAALCALPHMCVCTPADDIDPFEADCRTFCNLEYNCGLSPTKRENCPDFCQDEFELEAAGYGDACEDAFKDAMACLAGMTCDEFQNFQGVPLEEEPCYQVLDPYYELCPGVFIAPKSD